MINGYSANTRRFGQAVVDSNRLRRAANNERVGLGRSVAAGNAGRGGREIRAGANGISRRDPSGRAGVRTTRLSEVRGHGNRAVEAGSRVSGRSHGSTGNHFRMRENTRGSATAHDGGTRHLKTHGNFKGSAQGHDGGMRQFEGHKGFGRFASRGPGGSGYGSDRQRRMEHGGHGKGGQDKRK